jgi:hypothetical protein
MESLQEAVINTYVGGTNHIEWCASEFLTEVARLPHSSFCKTQGFAAA